MADTTPIQVLYEKYHVEHVNDRLDNVRDGILAAYREIPEKRAKLISLISIYAESLHVTVDTTLTVKYLVKRNRRSDVEVVFTGDFSILISTDDPGRAFSEAKREFTTKLDATLLQLARCLSDASEQIDSARTE